MFSKLALFVASTLAIAAVATPAPFADTYKCNTGNVQCCNSAEFVNNDNRAAMVTLLGAVAQGVTGKIHTQCTSVTGIGAGQASTCKSAPICCEKNKTNAIAAVDCNSINAF